jgi:hypothetical protein
MFIRFRKPVVYAAIYKDIKDEYPEGDIGHH